MAQHPLRCLDWCIPEVEKREIKSCGIKRVVVSSAENIIKYGEIKLLLKQTV